MERSFLQRLLQPLAEIRSGEAGTALMMFAYSFLAMTVLQHHSAADTVEAHFQPGRRRTSRT